VELLPIGVLVVAGVTVLVVLVVVLLMQLGPEARAKSLIVRYNSLYLAEFQRYVQIYISSGFGDIYIYQPNVVAAAHESSSGFARKTMRLDFFVAQSCATGALQLAVQRLIPLPYREQYEGQQPPAQ